jgi:magnesium-transporting ATPase (P-type)
MIENNTDQIISDEFSISPHDLEFLMQTHNHDCIKELNETYGGLYGLEKKLQTNLLTGLTGDLLDLNNRKKIFGRNELPKKSSKSFFRLMFEALQDITLIILIICSLISFGLAFYHSDHHVFEFHLKKQHRKKIFFFSSKFNCIHFVCRGKQC